MIPLNKPYLPSFVNYQKYLHTMYENKWLTNNGPLLQELKVRLEEYLGVQHLLLTANGTTALQVAYKAFNLTGNVITTPYSFIATSSSINWLGIETKFTDIDPNSLNLCPKNALQAIDNRTSAIVPVHVYGNPCDVKIFDKIGKNKNIKIIYDAAHAFNIKIDGQSVLSHGDASILSFHTTKLFHTIEGGAIIFNNADDYQRASTMINFGIDPVQGTITGPGINGKLSEAHAAMGLAMLDDIDHILARRAHHTDLYKTLLNAVVEFPLWHEHANQNSAYFPVIFKTPEQCTHVFNALAKHSIQSRRYFSPSLNTIVHLRKNKPIECPLSQSISTRILCLPLFVDLSHEDIHKVCTIIKKTL